MNQRETLKIPSDSPPVVYEGVAGGKNAHRGSEWPHSCLQTDGEEEDGDDDDDDGGLQRPGC